MKDVLKFMLPVFILPLLGASRQTTPSPTTMRKITQTAGREQLGDFAPRFAHYNDDILFGENWNDADIDVKTRCIITVVALVSQGVTDSSLVHHLQNAKKNGVSKEQIAAVITHTAFYAGWPKAWGAFRLAKEVWAPDEPATPADTPTPKQQHAARILFPIGEPNTAYAKYFTGQSYLAPVSEKQVKIANVTFEPGCRNNWHIHRAAKGGGQVLIGIGGTGIYREWGKPPVKIEEGTVIHIPANVKHWHGAAPTCWFSHLAIEVDGEGTSNEWLEPVTDEEYRRAAE